MLETIAKLKGQREAADTTETDIVSEIQEIASDYNLLLIVFVESQPKEEGKVSRVDAEELAVREKKAETFILLLFTFDLQILLDG